MREVRILIAILVIAASVPFYFAPVMNNFPQLLDGIPMVILFFWTMLSVKVLPVLMVLEACLLILMSMRGMLLASEGRIHIAAMCISIVAWVILISVAGLPTR